MTQVIINNTPERDVVTITSAGPKGDKDQSPYFHTIHISGSEYSGSEDQAVLTALSVTGSIIPEGSGSWDLGSPSHPFRDLYITTASIKFVSRATGEVVSELSAQNVKDLKEGKAISPSRKLTTTHISGGLTVTGSTFFGKLINSGNFANVDFVASSSQDPFRGGSILTFDNSYHHLTDANNTYNGSFFGPNSAYAQQFYVGNYVLSTYLNQTPEVNLMISSSGKSYIGPLLEADGTMKDINATLHISGNSPNWNALLVEGNISASGTLTVGTISNVVTTNITTSGNISASGYISASSFSGDGSGLTSLNVTEIVSVTTGSLTCSGVLSSEPIYAPAFIETGTGTPTIESDSNLVLSASNAVVVAFSPLRLSSLTNTNTGSGEFTFTEGDVYFNTTTKKFYGYDGTNHVVIGTQT